MFSQARAKLAFVLVLIGLLCPAYGLQYSVSLRTAQAAQVNATIGAAPNFLLYSGSLPANCAASAPSGTIINITCPTAPFAAAASGAIAQNSTWSGTATGSGTAATWRLYDSAGTCHAQGNVTSTGGGGDLTLDNPAIVSGQTVQITTFSLTRSNN